MRIPLLLLIPIFFCQNLSAQCPTGNTNVYGFTYNATYYEIVKENRTWAAAAACAVARGGYLAEINDAAEQAAIFAQANSMAGITTANTTAPDGGGAAYMWLGGNDLATEGAWNWDGDNVAPATAQFWSGTGAAGMAVGGLYSNWGSSGFGAEPDNFGSGQDGLGMALTNWPLGTAGQWNDISETNTLYYIIESPNIPVSVELINFNATPKENHILVEWATASETNNAYFILQKSDNGISFRNLTQVIGALHSTEIKKYSFIDKKIKNNRNVYYRLKQVDIDKGYEMSNVIHVLTNGQLHNEVHVYPNPSNMGLNFSFNTKMDYATLILTDLTGKVILNEDLNISEKNFSFPINQAGLYFYSLKVRNKENGVQFIKGKINIY